ncbi:MAG: 16S rRNA (cytosine(967)-C(5))-methyltransferase RsmB [Pyrinomonadaceae bacterium]
MHRALCRRAQRRSLDPPIRCALRLGLYQLRFLSRIPASAAVNESVNLAYRYRLRSAAGLINAVLRRAVREHTYDPVADARNDLERASLATSHPAWLIERWARSFGWDEALAFAQINNTIPPTAFRINTLRIEEESLLRRLSDQGAASVTRSLIAPGAWRIEGGSNARLQELTREGLIYLQDEASQLVSTALDPQPGERILDVCAAPGSKATHAAIKMRDTGHIVAGDIHLHRLKSLRTTAARQNLQSLSLLAFDAEIAIPFADGAFDRVLIDAPCTGTGTLRHNPEIRWRLSAAGITELAKRQKIMLNCSARAVKLGGRLVYSTCSVETEENEDVVAAFLADHSEFNLVAAHLPTELSNSFGAARTWPQRHGADGFFIAVLEKNQLARY